MSNEIALTTIEQREITPAVWQMIGAIVQTTSVSQIERAKVAQKMLFAYENNLPLNLAFNGGLYSVNNRVEVEGNVIRAQLRKHPHYDYEIVELNAKKCTLTITYDGKTIGEVTFTIDEAHKIINSKTGKKLTDSDTWQNYPADMLLNRATSRAYKRFAPDIFFTPVYVRGEIEGEEYLPEDSVPVEYEVQPQNGSDYSTEFAALVADFSPEEIQAANEGKVPYTLEQVRAVRAALEAQEAEVTE